MDHTQPAAVWIDGDPQMEAVAAAVWEQCRTEDTSLVVDDPRNIAAVAVAAIRTAAGVQPEPEERRERYAAAILAALARDTTNGPNWGAAADAAMAVADEEQRELRAELEDVRRDADYFQGWAEGNGNRLNTALADITRLRAELEQARGTTGQDTTPSLAEGEQEIRQQIADALEAADYRMDMRRGDLADAVLPVVRAAVAAVQEDLAFVRRVTIPELWREVVRHADGKQRWRKRAEKAEAAVSAAVRPALEAVADDWAAHCPEHSTSTEVSMSCRCDDANELRQRADALWTPADEQGESGEEK